MSILEFPKQMSAINADLSSASAKMGKAQLEFNTALERVGAAVRKGRDVKLEFPGVIQSSENLRASSEAVRVQLARYNELMVQLEASIKV